MDAVSGAILDVDDAGAYFATVDELEHRKQRAGAPESRPDRGSMQVR